MFSKMITISRGEKAPKEDFQALNGIQMISGHSEKRGLQQARIHNTGFSCRTWYMCAWQTAHSAELHSKNNRAYGEKVSV